MLGGKLYTAVFNTDNNNNNKCFWFCFVFEHQVSVFEGFLKGSCDTEDSYDADNSALHQRNTLHFKYRN